MDQAGCMFSWRALRVESVEGDHTYLTEAFDGDIVECVALYQDDSSGLPMHVADFPPEVSPMLSRLVEQLNE